MKITFIKDHEGLFAKAKEFREVEDEVGKHLIRYGYASNTERQRPKEVKVETKPIGEVKDGTTDGKVHAVGSKTNAS